MGGPVVTSPEETLKTVWRRLEDLPLPLPLSSSSSAAAAAGRLLLVGGGGGGTEKRARSCASVSRMRDVMSWLERSALVKILGGGKLGFHDDVISRRKL